MRCRASEEHAAFVVDVCLVSWSGRKSAQSGGLTGTLGSRAYPSSRGGGGRSNPNPNLSFPFLFAEPAEMGLRTQEKMLTFSRSPRMRNTQDRGKRGIRVPLLLLGVLVCPG